MKNFIEETLKKRLTMCRVNALCILLLACVVQDIGSDDHGNNHLSDCDGTDKCILETGTSSHNKYTQESNTKWKSYLESIEKAELKYQPCTKSCSCYSGIIKKNLLPWKNGGITIELVQKAKERGTFYQIVDHRLYREKDCMFPFRCTGVEHFILKIIDKLPDMEFVLNTRDWPQVPKSYEPFPVLSFSKTEDYYDIMYPAWTFWEGGPAISLYPTGLGRWDLHRTKLKDVAEVNPWESKEEIAFFRGSRTSSERDPLVLLSRSEPTLVDAQYTKNQAWKSEADTLGRPPATEVSFEEHCHYKYLFNYRGVAASFRLKHLFLCKSLVLHVGSDWLEFFYPLLKPWIHYVPLPSNARQEELRDILEFAQGNDKLVKKIADSGFQFIWDHLGMNVVSCYWTKLLKGYAGLLNYKVSRDFSLEEVRSRQND